MRRPAILLSAALVGNGGAFRFLEHRERTSSNRASCPPGWTCLGKRAFRVFDDRKNWVDAEKACEYEGPGVRLATVNSREENDLLWSLGGGGHTWIGLSDRATEGDFRWVDGQDAQGRPYRNWWRWEPNDAGRREDCAHLWHPGSGTWNDLPCDWKVGVWSPPCCRQSCDGKVE